MRSFPTKEFWELYAQLPVEARESAERQYQTWKSNPKHPSLHFKRLRCSTWSVRINLYYRALGVREGNDVYWFWIGSHKEYDRIVKNLFWLI